MNLINNRYRVIKNLIQSRLVSTYKVTDVMNNHQVLNLNIINSEYLSQDLLSFLLNEFITLANINNSSIAKVYDFGLIYSIDNKILDTNQYFYTSENVSDEIDISDVIYELKEKDVIDIFVQVCQAVNYLHLKGYNYGELNLKNILLHEYGFNYSIKLKDLATIELDKYNYWSKTHGQAFFKAPELMKGNKPNKISDIYSLGVLLLALCFRETDEYFNVSERLQLLNSEDQGSSTGRLAALIERLTNVDVNLRPQNIYEIVNEINELYHTDYKPHIVEDLEKLNFNIKLTGRDKEIARILEIHEAMEKHSAREKFVLVHGELGIGKTRFLKEVDMMLTLRKCTVYSSFAFENSNSKSNKALVDILKQIISECDQELLERYQGELVKLIPELGERKSIVLPEILNGDKEKFRLLSRILSFIYDFAKNKPIVFAIDNAHLMDSFTIELLGQIHENSIKDKNMLIMLSYSDSDYNSNKEFADFIARTRGKVETVDIPLNGLSSEETGVMIQRILNMAHSPKELSVRVFSTTYGNPLFIQETIKDFFSKKVVYINPDQGKWYLKYDSYDQIPIPSSMEQAALNQVKETSEEDHEILNVISIFNTAVSIENITSFVSRDINSVESSIMELVSKGILCRKIEDRGFVYDFYNKVLKNIIYNKLSDEAKVANHELAAATLEKQYVEDGIENNEELIFHLEKAGKKDKVIKYCTENATKLVKFKIREAAVKNLEKALSMFEQEDISRTKAELTIKIAEMYSEDGNITLAMDFYKKAEKIAEKIGDKKFQVDILNYITSAYFRKNNMKNTIKYSKKSQEILRKLDYTHGYLESSRMQASICDVQQKYDQAYEIAVKCLELCGEDQIKHKGYFHNIIGNVFLETSKPDEALAQFKKAIEYFEQINFYQGMTLALNNIGVIYGDFYQDNERSIDCYLKMREISQKNNIVRNEVLALTNLGSCYIFDSNFEDAYENLKEALEKSKRIEYESNIFYCLNYLMYVCTKLNRYHEAYEYYLLAEKELADYPEHGKTIGIYHYTRAELNFEFGNFSKAFALSAKSNNIYDDDESTMKLDIELQMSLIEIYRNNGFKNISEIAKNLEKLIKSYSSINNQMNYACDACIMLYENGYKERANRLFKAFSSVEGLRSDRVQGKYEFIKAMFNKGGSRINHLESALEHARRSKDRKLQWKVYNMLGDSYFIKKNYFFAVNYYFEACEVIKSLVQQLPEEFRVNFVKKFNMTNPFNKLREIKQHYANTNKNAANTKDSLGNIKSHKDLEELFNYEDLAEIFNNKSFTNSAKKLYKSNLPVGVNSFSDIVSNISEDSIKNLEIIANFIAANTLATRCMIITEDREKGLKVIASSDDSKDISCIKNLVSTVKDLGEPLLISESLINKNRIEVLQLPQDVKAVICIPIISQGLDEKQIQKDSRQNMNPMKNIKGYLYIESQRVLNNFTEISLKECIEMIPFIAFIIDKYLLKVVSSIDKLTGTYTRKFLEDALSDHIEKASLVSGVFSIIMFDLDYFKGINDRFGHQTGDEVLKQVCKIVMEGARKGDFCGRYGGEEFILILPGADSETAYNIADRHRKNIENAKILGDKREVTVSMGVATYPDHAQWKQDLIESADQALYVAKATGRNKCQVWNSDFSKSTKGTDKLAGIITGNTVQDSRNVLVMIELLELIKSEGSFEDKIYSMLGRIIEFTEAEQGMFFIINNNEIINKYSRKIFEDGWTEIKYYNKTILDNVINTKQGIYNIDWDDIVNYNLVTGMPDWHSIAVVPVITSGLVKGVLYLTVSTKAKEFKFEDYNLIATLANTVAAML